MTLSVFSVRCFLGCLSVFGGMKGVKIVRNDLISRKALIAEYDRVHIGPPGGARKLMEDAPGVDAVEVVRCKDCKHCKKHPTSDRVKMCTNEQQWVTECYPLVHDDDFCSYGERREGE